VIVPAKYLPLMVTRAERVAKAFGGAARDLIDD
jgi:hypothetical protein